MEKNETNRGEFTFVDFLYIDHSCIQICENPSFLNLNRQLKRKQSIKNQHAT